MRFYCIVTAFLSCFALGAAAGESQRLRPPAVPLVTHDPYFSIWSFADHPGEDWPRHWTGGVNALCSMVRVDGKTYRLLGSELRDVDPARLISCRVLPTRTIYRFEAGAAAVTLVFTSPLVADDLDLVGRPVSYISWTVQSADSGSHQVEIYFDHTGELVVHEAKQEIVWSRPEVEGLSVMRMGSAAQPVLERDGDGVRIDWGYVYLAAPTGKATTRIAAASLSRGGFAGTGKVDGEDDAQMPRPAQKDWPVSAIAMDCGRTGAEPLERWLMLAYDDLYSIQYLGENLRAWWRRDGTTPERLLQMSAAEYPRIAERCAAFDEELMADLRKVGGDEYADLCALAYRQAIAAHKLAVGPGGEPMMFSKECYSNGCIATVDVAYPASPIFMLFSSELLKATVEPVFRYAATDRWKFDFAPHDLGRYPKANGQRYGGGEKSEDRQMPVEESGNMLIMAATICQIEGNTRYVEKYWAQLSRWAGYLKAKGLDPANQLCTDDFAGHLAHNANLSLKAIVALGAYAKMCEMAGRTDESAEYRRTAEEFAARWPELADDGDHYRLAFDAPGTWSQKYNLVWDMLLGLKLFPPEIARREIAYYKTRLNRFGLPLDNRELYTKTDWQVWTATLAESRADFDALMAPVYAFVSQTPQRVPLTDWYWTNTAEKRGFQARPVIGGVFIKMLADAEMWKKWSARGENVSK